MKLRAVLWDVDGTMLNSEPLHLASLKAACAHYGADIDDLDDAHFIGVGFEEVWRELRPRFAPATDYAKWLSRINAHYVERAGTLSPMPGLYEVMEEFSRAGLRQVAVSNSHRVVVDANIAALGVADKLEFSLSADDFTALKPNPEPYLLALEKLGVSASEAIAIEDSEAGAKSARAAGIFTAGLLSEHARLEAADLRLGSLDELIPWHSRIRGAS